MGNMSPRIYHLKVDAAGRIVIPADARNRLQIKQGDELIAEECADGLRITTYQQAIREAQAYFAQFVPPGVSLSDELLKERREEAARE